LAHGVEGRYPFLDHRLFEFAARLPTRSKLRGLREKAILRRWARAVVPPAVVTRPKQPYRAPDIPSFCTPEPVAYARDLMEEAGVARVGLFDPTSVAGLLRRCRSGTATGVRENQAFVAILSTQLWHQHFIQAHARLRVGRVPKPTPDVALIEQTGVPS
jgi:asparagine synthase (glutamine-hydrolysing)